MSRPVEDLPPHVWREGSGSPQAAAPPLLLLHGTGGDEHDLLPFGDVLDPQQRLHVVTPRAPLTIPGWPGHHWYVVPRVGFPDHDTFHAAFDALAAFHDELWERTGLRPDQIDGLGSTGQGTLPPIEVAEYLGLRPRWIDSTSVGGASWEVMVAHAADAIAAGHADVVLLTYGSTSRSDLRSGLRTANLNWGSRGPLQWEAPYGHTLIAKYAMAARRHMHEYGTTIEHNYNAGWGVLTLSSYDIFQQSRALPGPQTMMLGSILTNETDPLFSWQYQPDAPCPNRCVRVESTTRAGTTCSNVTTAG